MKNYYEYKIVSISGNKEEKLERERLLNNLCKNDEWKVICSFSEVHQISVQLFSTSSYLILERKRTEPDGSPSSISSIPRDG
jgi:hypothetical protein